MMEKDKSEELRVGFLKHLDSLFCNENKSTCVWADNSLIIVDSDLPTHDKDIHNEVHIQLNVSFYINSQGTIITTCIK